MANGEHDISQKTFLANNVKSGTKTNNLKALTLQSFTRETAIIDYKLSDKYSIDRFRSTVILIISKHKLHKFYDIQLYYYIPSY